MNDLAERRQEEKERRRAQILDAAEAVAGKNDWDAITMDQVARKARVSRPLLYIYFQDKTDLMYGIAERALHALHARFLVAAAHQGRGIDRVRAMGRAYVAFSREEPLYFSILARCELRSPAGDATTNEYNCLKCGDELQSLLVAALEAGQRDGSVRQDLGDPRRVGIALWGFTHGVISLATTKANVLAHHGAGGDALLDVALLMAARSVATDPDSLTLRE